MERPLAKNGLRLQLATKAVIQENRIETNLAGISYVATFWSTRAGFLVSLLRYVALNARTHPQRCYQLRSTRRLWPPLVVLLVVSWSAQSENPVVVGHVAGLSGQWYLYPDVSAESSTKRLGNHDEVYAYGVIRNRSPSVRDHISIVDLQLKVIIDKKCQPLSSCYQPIFLPEMQNTPLPGQELFGKVWAVLAGDERLRSLVRVRGASPRFAEGVVPIVDRKADLSEVISGLEKGRYSLGPLYESPAADRARPAGVEFDWDPDKRQIVSIGDQPPGLYKISPMPSPGDMTPTPRIAVLVLLCAGSSCQQAVASFQLIQSLTAKWAGAASPETIHAFRRAYITELAKARGLPEQ
jgi:hypothetical protein